MLWLWFLTALLLRLDAWGKIHTWYLLKVATEYVFIYICWSRCWCCCCCCCCCPKHQCWSGGITISLLVAALLLLFTHRKGCAEKLILFPAFCLIRVRDQSRSVWLGTYCCSFSQPQDPAYNISTEAGRGTGYWFFFPRFCPLHCDASDVYCCCCSWLILFLSLRPFPTRNIFDKYLGCLGPKKLSKIFLENIVWEIWEASYFTVQKYFFLFLMAGCEGVSMWCHRGSRW